MKATFKLDGCHDLQVTTEPRYNHPGEQRGLVSIEILRTPLGGLESAASDMPRPSDISDENLIYYGPYECRCGKQIVALSGEQGGYKYEAVHDLPVYPNSAHGITWREHDCVRNPSPVTVLAHQWKPSEARAVASAILSAATESK